MKKIISKLSIKDTDLRYNYLINDVSLGISLALKHKKVIKHKEALKQLESMYVEIKKIPISTPWNDIDLNNQFKAYKIGLNALSIIEEVI